METTHEMAGKSCDGRKQKPKQFLHFRAPSPAQPYPPGCPQEKPQSEAKGSGPDSDLLGRPLNIREVAEVLGCSPWTVRHRYLEDGLPHFRTGPTGKLIFYKNQVIRWLLKEQQKGGQT